MFAPSGKEIDVNTKAKIFADADHNGAGARVLVSQPSSYTPGPWRVDESAMKVRASNGLTVAEPFTKADAFLIAAAPDMLAALREVVFAETERLHAADNDRDYLAQQTRMATALAFARAVIAKATGAA